MNKAILSQQQIQLLVSENRYPVDEKTKFQSRCIDGRYQNKLKVKSEKLKVTERELPALAFPGGDIGELALIFAAANVYGFEVDGEKLFQSLIEIIGDEKNFSWHTDDHADPKIPAAGCGHWKQLQLDPKTYQLEDQQIKFIGEKLTILSRSARDGNYYVLEGEHREGAILLVKGDWGIYPRCFLEPEEGRGEVEVFVYHQSLVDERHRVLSNALLKNKAVKLYPGCDEEYLYEVLSEMAENHLFETIKRLAKELPIFQVKFDDDGGFEIKEE